MTSLAMILVCYASIARAQSSTRGPVSKGPGIQPTTAQMDAAAACALSTLSARHSAHSQKGEDILLLPTLLAATGGKPGTYVEIGALDGIKYSNTRSLDVCYGWYGLLIEGNPANFRQLLRTKRNAKKVHAAVCASKKDGSDNTIEFSAEGGQLAGAVNFLLDRNSKFAGKPLNLSTVDVPCRPLTRIMNDEGFAAADFLSLDVEGAEEEVLKNSKPEAFKVVLVEWRDRDRALRARIHQKLIGAGLRQAEQLKVPDSRVYLAPGVPEIFVNSSWLKLFAGKYQNEIRVVEKYRKKLSCLLSRFSSSCD